MKKLMTFELYKSTYMSAASELEGGHKKRAEELRKHAAEKGISAFQGRFDRIYGHPFIFETYDSLKHREEFLGKFFITDFEDHIFGSYTPNYHGVKVIMKSDYGNTIKLEVVVGPEGFHKMDLEYGIERPRSLEINNFKFTNRRDAFQLRKFILEIVEDGELERGDYFFNLDTLPINKLYTTE